MAAHFDDSQIRELGRQWIDNGQRLHDYVATMDSGMASMESGWTGKAGHAAQVTWSGVADHNVRHALLEAGQVAQDVGNAIIAYADELQKTVKEINRAHLVEALATIFGLVLGLASFGIAGLLSRLLAAVADIVAGLASRISAIASAAAGVGRGAAFVTDAVINAALTLGTDVVANLMGSKAANAPLHIDWESEGMNVALGVWMGAGMGGIETAQNHPNTVGRGLPQVSASVPVPKPTSVDVSAVNQPPVFHGRGVNSDILGAFSSANPARVDVTKTVESVTDYSVSRPQGPSSVDLSVSSNLRRETGTNHLPPVNEGVPNPAAASPRTNAGREGAAAPTPENVIAVEGRNSHASPTGHPVRTVPDATTGRDMGAAQFSGDRPSPVPLAREGGNVAPTPRTSNTFLDAPPRSASEGTPTPAVSQDAVTGSSRAAAVSRSGMNEATPMPVSTPAPRPEGAGEAVPQNGRASRGGLSSGATNVSGSVVQASGPAPHPSAQAGSVVQASGPAPHPSAQAAERGALTDGGTGRSASTRGPDTVHEGSAETGTAKRGSNRPEGQARPHSSNGSYQEPDGTVPRSQSSVELETSGVRTQANRSVESPADQQPLNRQHDIGSGTTAHAGSRPAGEGAKAHAQGFSDGLIHSGVRHPVDDAHTPASRDSDPSGTSILGSDGPTPALKEWTDFTHAQTRREELVVDAEARLEGLGSYLDDAWRRGFERYVAGDELGIVNLKFDSHEVRRARWEWRQDITRAFRNEARLSDSINTEAFNGVVQGAEKNAHKYLERSRQVDVLASKFKAEVEAFRAGGPGTGYRADLPEFTSTPGGYVYDSKLNTFVRDDSKKYGVPAAENEGPKKITGPDGDEIEVFVTSDDRRSGPIDYFRDKALDFNPLELLYIQKVEQFNGIFSGYLHDQNVTTLPSAARHQIDGITNGLYDDLETIAVREHRINAETGQLFDDTIARQATGNGGRDALSADSVARIREEFLRDLRDEHDLVFKYGATKGAYTLWDLATTRAVDGLPGRITRERFIQSKLAEETTHAESYLSGLSKDALDGLGEAGQQRVLGEYLGTVRDHARNHYTAMMNDGRTAATDIEAGWAGQQGDVRTALPRTVRHEVELRDVVTDAAHDFHGIVRHPDSIQAHHLHEDTLSRLGNDVRTERVQRYDELFAPEGHKTDVWLAHESAFEDGFQVRLDDLRADHLEFPTSRDRAAGSSAGDDFPAGADGSRPPRSELADTGTTADGDRATPQPWERNDGGRTAASESNGEPQQGRTSSDAGARVPREAQQIQVTGNHDLADSSGTAGFSREHTVRTRFEEQDPVVLPSRQERERPEQAADLPSAVRDWLRSHSVHVFDTEAINHAHQQLLDYRPSAFADLPLHMQAVAVGSLLNEHASGTVAAASSIVLQNTGVYPRPDGVRAAYQDLLTEYAGRFRDLPQEQRAGLVAMHVQGQNELVLDVVQRLGDAVTPELVAATLRDLTAEDGLQTWTTHESPAEMLEDRVRLRLSSPGRPGQGLTGFTELFESSGELGHREVDERRQHVAGSLAAEATHGWDLREEWSPEGAAGVRSAAEVAPAHGDVSESRMVGTSGGRAGQDGGLVEEASLLSHGPLFGRDAQGFISGDAVYLVHGETLVSVPRDLERTGGEAVSAAADEAVYAVLLQKAEKALQKLTEDALLSYQEAAQLLMDGRHRSAPPNLSGQNTEDEKLLENIRSVVAYQLYLDRSSEGEAAQRNAMLVSEWLRRVHNTQAVDGFVVPGSGWNNAWRFLKRDTARSVDAGTSAKNVDPTTLDNLKQHVDQRVPELLRLVPEAGLAQGMLEHTKNELKALLPAPSLDEYVKVLQQLSVIASVYADRGSGYGLLLNQTVETAREWRNTGRVPPAVESSIQSEFDLLMGAGHRSASRRPLDVRTRRRHQAVPKAVHSVEEVQAHFSGQQDSSVTALETDPAAKEFWEVSEKQKTVLRERGLEPVWVPDDGDCFFHSLINVMHARYSPAELDILAERNSGRRFPAVTGAAGVQALRDGVADFLEEEDAWNEYKHFFAIDEGEDHTYRGDFHLAVLDEVRTMHSWNNGVGDVIPMLVPQAYGVAYGTLKGDGEWVSESSDNRYAIVQVTKDNVSHYWATRIAEPSQVRAELPVDSPQPVNARKPGEFKRVLRVHEYPGDVTARSGDAARLPTSAEVRGAAQGATQASDRSRPQADAPGSRDAVVPPQAVAEGGGLRKPGEFKRVLRVHEYPGDVTARSGDAARLPTSAEVRGAAQGATQASDRSRPQADAPGSRDAVVPPQAVAEGGGLQQQEARKGRSQERPSVQPRGARARLAGAKARTPDDSRSRSRVRNRIALGRREWRGPVLGEVKNMETKLLESGAGSRVLVMAEKENKVVYTWAINVLGQSVKWDPLTPDSSWERVTSLHLNSEGNLIDPPAELVALSDSSRNFDATNFCSVTPGRDMTWAR